MDSEDRERLAISKSELVSMLEVSNELVCECVRACVRACVHACVRACVRACMRAYVRVCACASGIAGNQSSYRQVSAVG